MVRANFALCLHFDRKTAIAVTSIEISDLTLFASIDVDYVGVTCHSRSRVTCHRRSPDAGRQCKVSNVGARVGAA